MTSLSDYYARWDRVARGLDDAESRPDAHDAQAAPPGGAKASPDAKASLGAKAPYVPGSEYADLKAEDIGVRVGAPLTAEQFAAFRAAGGRADLLGSRHMTLGGGGGSTEKNI
jgi:hypothetical protein